jgi:para-nitrobenzyl esterase
VSRRTCAACRTPNSTPRAQSEHGKGKVFSYYYDNHGSQTEGSGHGSDVSFHFQTLRGTPTRENVALSDMISSYDINFAKTGDPNGKALPPWPAFDAGNPQVMVFDAKPGARTYPLLQQVKALGTYFERIAAKK